MAGFLSSSVKRALIIAAGRGMRLDSHSREVPKSLIPIGDRSIMQIILETLSSAAIAEAIIVTGYKADILEERLGDGSKHGVCITFVRNDHWELKNGVSVHLARHLFSSDEQFLLMMSDHLFSINILHDLIEQPLNPGEVSLAVDTRLDSIFDIDDATKVFVEGSLIRRIGKTLRKYNGVDCGLFKCTSGIFDALDAAMAVEGDCSLTDGGKELALQGRLKAVPIKNGHWIDIDTPEALEHAVKLLRPLRLE